MKSVHDAQKQVPHFRFDRRGATRVEPLFHESLFHDPHRLRSAEETRVHDALDDGAGSIFQHKLGLEGFGRTGGPNRTT